MKKTLLVLFLLLSVQTIVACSCVSHPLLHKITLSDFIATAKITKVTPDKDNVDRHDIEIEIIDLYKGDATTHLKVYSNLNTSCAFLTAKHSTWLIFASKNEDAILSFGYCSGSKQIDRTFAPSFKRAKKRHQQAVKLELEALKYIQDSGVKISNEFNLTTAFRETCFNDNETTNTFALYELTIERDLSISNVTTVKALDNTVLNSKLLQCAQDHIKIYAPKRAKGIAKQTKIIVGMYYNALKKKVAVF